MTTYNVFVAQLAEFSKKLERTEKEVFHAIVDLANESVVLGSPITGSPGQPADLRDGDWTTVYEGETSALISTSERSARSVEDGVSHKHGGVPLSKLHSPIGGFHSVGLTQQHFDKIVEEVIHRIVGSNA